MDAKLMRLLINLHDALLMDEELLKAPFAERVLSGLDRGETIELLNMSIDLTEFCPICKNPGKEEFRAWDNKFCSDACVKEADRQLGAFGS